MRIAIMGAGAIGSFYGFKLARAGHAVAFIARGAHLEALRTQGLRVRQDAGETLLASVEATDDPAAVGPVELVLVTTKAYHLDDAARAMQPLVGPDTAVLPLLNGVDVHERLGAVLGGAPMLGGLTYLPATVEAPGVVHQPGYEPPLIFGEPAGGLSPRVERIAAVLNGAGIVAEATDDIRRALWQKFVLINCNGGVSAVTDATLGRVREDPDVYALYEACAREVVAVAHALGVHLAPDAHQGALDYLAAAPPGLTPSMLHDVRRGRPLELESLNGTLVRLGRQAGVPTPVNRMLYAALKLRADGTGG